MYSVCVWSYCVFVILLVFYCVFVILLVFYIVLVLVFLSLSLSLSRSVFPVRYNTYISRLCNANILSPSMLLTVEWRHFLVVTSWNSTTGYSRCYIFFYVSRLLLCKN